MTVMVEKLQIWIYSYGKCLQQYLISNVNKECEHCVVDYQYCHITIEHVKMCPLTQCDYHMVRIPGSEGAQHRKDDRPFIFNKVGISYYSRVSQGHILD